MDHTRENIIQQYLFLSEVKTFFRFEIMRFFYFNDLFEHFIA